MENKKINVKEYLSIADKIKIINTVIDAVYYEYKEVEIGEGQKQKQKTRREMPNRYLEQMLWKVLIVKNYSDYNITGDIKNLVEEYDEIIQKGIYDNVLLENDSDSKCGDIYNLIDLYEEIFEEEERLLNYEQSTGFAIQMLTYHLVNVNEKASTQAMSDIKTLLNKAEEIQTKKKGVVNEDTSKNN